MKYTDGAVDDADEEDSGPIRRGRRCRSRQQEKSLDGSDSSDTIVGLRRRMIRERGIRLGDMEQGTGRGVAKPGKGRLTRRRLRKMRLQTCVVRLEEMLDGLSREIGLIKDVLDVEESSDDEQSAVEA